VKIGKKCAFGYKLGGFHRGGSIEIQARYKNSVIKLGDNIATNNNIFICAANYIEIGNETLIGQYVMIIDHEAHGVDPCKRRGKIGEIGKVIVGKNVWIGSNVTILKNSEIGDNSIVAAGAVVSGKFPENVIIGGVPAKIIKRI
jgi:acetyltransferase-like isoleucine patch superfamily enzyme